MPPLPAALIFDCDGTLALTGDLQNDYPIYHCVASQTYNGGEGEVTWYLYAKTK